ncbi:MAG TPA: DUF5686 family protein [Cyclobacteriaceae bacterium]|nr:DUF5686 family protein [Cyclobacteriaceae bacterium]
MKSTVPFRLYLVTISLLLFVSGTKGQHIIQGKLIDSLTRQPIAFANLSLEDGRTGTTTEIEGNFTLTIPSDYTGSIYISHVSYQKQILPLSYFQSYVEILLQPSATHLQEVGIVASRLENPAFAIIRKAVDHRKDNDPSNLTSYQYISYNKFLVTMSGSSKRVDSIINALKSRPDTVKLKKKQKQLLLFDSLVNTTHFFLSESITEKEVINPDKQKEKLLALKVSGYKSPIFTNVATAYQPFSFYKDNISLLGKDFINPVSKGTFSRYDFVLKDTTYLGQDTVYVIQFQPKSGSLFNGLKGVVSICTDGYAIKNIIASSADATMLTDIRIQQNYEKIDQHWFPIQLNTDLDFHDYKFAGRHMIAQHRSFLKEIKINPALKKSSFGDITTELTLPKADENKLILDRYRNNLLDKREARTYTLVDSMMRKLGWIDGVIEAMIAQTIPLGPLEMDLDKLIKFNRYESLRLGAGIYTSNRFSKWLRLGGYAGYGFRDEQWKYGGEMKFNFNLNRDFFLRFSYVKDIYETGSSHIHRDGQFVGNESFRNWNGYLYDKIEFYKGEIGYRILPDVHTSIFIVRNEIQPTYNYQLILNNELTNRFLITETGLTFRYVYKENYMILRGKKILNGTRFPVFTFSVIQAIPAFEAKDFNYTLFDFTAKHQIKHRYGGKTNLFFTSGWVNGLAPYGKLYNGRGTNATTVLVDNYFQTMGLYEFTSSKYASVFLTHNVGNILVNKWYSKPELLLYQNMGIGQLENKDAHVGLVLQDFSKGFVESGIGLNNILRAKYFNVAYWGFGGAAFYRYGPYQFAQPSNNLFWKMTFTFGF